MLNTIINPFFEYINTFNASSDIGVAVSGGPDSLAMTLLLHEWHKMKGDKGRFVALTVNHNLRPDAAAEAECVHSLMKKFGIEHHILNWNHDGSILSNVASLARKARLELLTNWCKEHSIDTIALAHTKNDIAETFFINIFRGSGLDGLASIPIDNVYNDVRIIRPVSIFTKHELMQFLLESGVEWVEDPSNSNDKFLRAKLRKLFASSAFKAIFPDENLFLKRIMTNVNNINRAKHFVDSSIAQAKADAVQVSSLGYIVIDRIKFKALHSEIAMHILADCLVTVSGKHEYKPRLNTLQSLYKAICSNKDLTKTLWSCAIQSASSEIYVYKEMGKTKPSTKHLSDGSLLWDHRFVIKAGSNLKIKQVKCVTFTDLKQLKLEAKLPIKKICCTLPLVLFQGGVHIPFLMKSIDGLEIFFKPKLCSFHHPFYC